MTIKLDLINSSKRLQRGIFISFEGGEGSGKSTQSKLLAEYLSGTQIPVIHTREVGGTVAAEKIRDILVNYDLQTMSELMLVMAARYEHLKQVIIPALLAGKWVICDRFIDSTASYQSCPEMSIADIFALHSQLMKMNKTTRQGVNDQQISSWLFAWDILPDVTFFMDLPPHKALERALARDDSNKFEQKPMSFHAHIYNNYQKLCALFPERIKAIDCVDKTIEQIHEEIRQII